MRTLKSIAVLGIWFLLSGCVTTMQDRRQAEVREDLQKQNLRLTVKRLEEQVAGLSEAQQQAYRETESVRKQSQLNRERIEARLSGLEASQKQASAARAQLRADIIAELSGKMATIIRTHVPDPGLKRGREHVVKSGETVSEIATAYGGSVPAIVKANKLSDAAVIRVGQTLFIPE